MVQIAIAGKNMFCYGRKPYHYITIFIFVKFGCCVTALSFITPQFYNLTCIPKSSSSTLKRNTRSRGFLTTRILSSAKI